MITGYNDTFNRTVASGLGTATSGQVYTVNGTASQYSVTPGTASILPTATAERYGYVDRLTSDIDITGQVALSGVPATNLQTVGFIIKRLDGSNYYNATMMVATGGGIQLRVSRLLAGSLSTLTSVATGLTYVANTFYNLRVQAFWSDSLQANVIRLKLWAIGATEPGGWGAQVTDAGLTQYTAGTGAGIFTRDEATTPGTITAKIQNVAAKTYGLPVPATTDTFCADPSVMYPKQTALQSMAQAADVVMAGLDPRISLAQTFQRVRVSRTNWTLPSGFYTATYDATEFNVGTSTDLSYASQYVVISYGIWLVTFEIELVPAARDYIQISLYGGTLVTAGPTVYMRSELGVINDEGWGGTGRISAVMFATDPVLTVNCYAQILTNGGTYTVKYSALSAIKISDYF